MLYDLSRQIPQLKKDIQDGLLKMLSLVLMHKPLRHPGMPKGLAHQLASPSLTNIPEASDVGSITLALRTLGSFEFEGKNLKRPEEKILGLKQNAVNFLLMCFFGNPGTENPQDEKQAQSTNSVPVHQTPLINCTLNLVLSVQKKILLPSVGSGIMSQENHKT